MMEYKTKTVKTAVAYGINKDNQEKTKVMNVRYVRFNRKIRSDFSFRQTAYTDLISPFLLNKINNLHNLQNSLSCLSFKGYENPAFVSRNFNENFNNFEKNQNWGFFNLLNKKQEKSTIAKVTFTNNPTLKITQTESTKTKADYKARFDYTHTFYYPTYIAKIGNINNNKFLINSENFL